MVLEEQHERHALYLSSSSVQSFVPLFKYHAFQPTRPVCHPTAQDTLTNCTGFCYKIQKCAKSLAAIVTKRKKTNSTFLALFCPFFREQCKGYHYINFLLAVPWARCTWLHAILYTIQAVACTLWKLPLTCAYGLSDFPQKRTQN